MPLGATVEGEGVNFAVYSSRATSVTLVLFCGGEAAREIVLDPHIHRTGDVWHVLVPDAHAGMAYGFRMDRHPNPQAHLDPFDPARTLLDPYSRALVRAGSDDEVLHRHRNGNSVPQRRSLIVEPLPRVQDEIPIHRHAADSVIYEAHLRGFTRHPSAAVEHPGTFRGLIEKIPYLQELGVTAVELMPIAEFEDANNPRSHPAHGEPLSNFWGYDPIALFAPKASYAADDSPGGQIREFRKLVQALHRARIEVILDVVFNHSGEEGEDGPTSSWRGIDNPTYYLVDSESGRCLNLTGCGNTLNCNHPVVRDLIVDCLRYWVVEMQVDGFRFDLASILTRGRHGEPLEAPPLLERIAADPVLARTKLIAEPWDAAGLYHVGSFPHWGRWAEWNGRFRDDVRRFVRGDPGLTSALASRLLGSPDLYRAGGRAPWHSINFVTCHDGFTLADLVSYDHKHNQANGEDGRDGSNHNFSWNCGEEGPSGSAEVNALRRRQVRNLAVLLMLSQGTPMILAGDEMGRSQQGNNNAYCQDNEIGWVDWELLEENRDLFRFFRLLIRFRLQTSLLRARSYETLAEAEWHGIRLNQPDFSEAARCLALHLHNSVADPEIHLIANADDRAHSFELPSPQGGGRWRLFIDTSREPPSEIVEEGDQRLLEDQSVRTVESYSVVVLVAS